ncbi:MAG: 16S rRNA (cytidine(1402)-2'-O)-methyltransferase [Clostridia bacterium]|nr:16S rRNA (cytidine(1402)-2'-O)-methyltransferase [Clostridia bacterium]
MGKLYVVGTPIGNLSDFSPRARETLQNVDFIAAEDTRVTLKLLNKFEIKNSLVSYHEHNRGVAGEKIVERILAGEDCAIVTDAGMPAISDPGEELVKLCRENNIEVESVPGPTAFATAIALSGMSSARFTFEGFLSVTKRQRKEHLSSLVEETRTMIFYEAPHKLIYTLKDMLEYFGNREIAICRELTKIHEEVINTTLENAIEKYEKDAPKGEFVLVIKGKEEIAEQNEITFDEAVLMAKKLMDEGNPASFAAKQAAANSGFKKSEIYKELCK